MRIRELWVLVNSERRLLCVPREDNGEQCLLVFPTQEDAEGFYQEGMPAGLAAELSSTILIAAQLAQFERGVEGPLRRLVDDGVEWVQGLKYRQGELIGHPYTRLRDWVDPHGR